MPRKSGSSMVRHHRYPIFLLLIMSPRFSRCRLIKPHDASQAHQCIADPPSATATRTAEWYATRIPEVFAPPESSSSTCTYRSHARTSIRCHVRATMSTLCKSVNADAAPKHQYLRDKIINAPASLPNAAKTGSLNGSWAPVFPSSPLTGFVRFLRHRISASLAPQATEERDALSTSRQVAMSFVHEHQAGCVARGKFSRSHEG